MNTMKRRELVVLLLILAIAAGMRFYALDRTPPGLYPDEAVNGTDAQEALATGDFKLFYPNNNGREGLFINIQALAVNFLGNTPFALRSVSALMGVLTVLAVYLLARRMFDSWELAAMAAFLMATGFWHVNFSRIGFRAIMAPLTAAWGFYYLYKGIETHRLWHWGLAGLFFGLGFHTYIAFRVMPLAVILVLAAYWLALWQTFRHGKYAHARHQMLGGVFTMIAVILLVALPMAAHFYANPGDLFGRTAKVSVWEADRPLIQLAKNTGLTLGMFVAHGDGNWRHNIAGAPALFWPVAAFFAAGLLHTLWRAWRSLRTRGHPGVVQTLLLAWFGVGLLPGILSNEGIPHALRVLTAAPAVYLIAAVGLHWLYVTLRKWYAARDEHLVCLPWFGHAGAHGRRMCTGEGTLVVAIAILSLLLAFGIGEARRYFVQWAHDPNVASEFNAHYLGIADRINALPPATLKYIVVSRGDVRIDGIPVSARTVMYLTDTGTNDGRKAKNVTYLTSEDFRKTRIPRGATVIHLDP